MALSNPKTSDHPLGALISNHPQTVVGNRGRMIQTYIALGIGTLLLLAGLIVFLAMAEAANQLTLICLGFGGFCALGIGMLGLGDARRTRDMSLELKSVGYATPIGMDKSSGHGAISHSCCSILFGLATLTAISMSTRSTTLAAIASSSTTIYATRQGHSA